MTGRIGVLCGGPSREREISLRSGQAVHEALLSLGLESIKVTLSQDPERIADEIRAAGISCAFVALHGWFGEDGTIQSILEQMQIPYTGSGVEACRYGMDKVFSRRRWSAAALPIARWALADSDSAPRRAYSIGFPLVIKPVSEGSSLGANIVDSETELAPAVEEAASFGKGVLLEEYLPGAELTVGILRDEPLPVVQVVPKRRFYDYEAKYTHGLTDYRAPAPLPDTARDLVQQVALRAHSVLGCRGFSRVDLILVPDRGPVLLELNPIPGMTQSSLLPKAAAAAGISFPELCRQMLASAALPSQPVGCSR